MQYGSIFGHGAYLGPDFTADYLHRQIGSMRARAAVGTAPRAQPIPAPPPWPHPTAPRRRSPRPSPATSRPIATTPPPTPLRFTAAQTAAFDDLVRYYTGYFSTPTTKFGLRRDAITKAQELRDLTAFFAWTAWAAAANRPGKQYSYTNNWPSETAIGNTPTADALLWSALSLIALIGGTGLLLAHLRALRLARLAPARAAAARLPQRPTP